MLKKLKKIAQMILGNKHIRRVINSFHKYTLAIFVSSRLGSIIYNIPIFFLFSREQHAYIHGKYKYYKNLNRPLHTRAHLRRNIHRLEKALLMQPLRDTFALNYIEETVEYYEDAINSLSRHKTNDFDTAELDWAHDVLDKYFNTVKSSEATAKLHDRYKALDYSPINQEVARVPYKRRESHDAEISYDQIYNLSKKRRSVRWFNQEPVPHELIDKAMKVARQAPSACNRLPYEFRFYDNPELLREISSIPFGASGYAYNIPMVAVLIGKQESYFSSRDRHVIYIDTSLAAMSFMFALETLGLGSSVINWPDFEPLEAKMQKTLKLDVDERPIMMMAIGYPDEDALVAFSQKKELNTVRSYNKVERTNL